MAPESPAAISEPEIAEPEVAEPDELAEPEADVPEAAEPDEADEPDVADPEADVPDEVPEPDEVPDPGALPEPEGTDEPALVEPEVEDPGEVEEPDEVDDPAAVDPEPDVDDALELEELLEDRAEDAGLNGVYSAEAVTAVTGTPTATTIRRATRMRVGLSGGSDGSECPLWRQSAAPSGKRCISSLPAPWHHIIGHDAKTCSSWETGATDTHRHVPKKQALRRWVCGWISLACDHGANAIA